MKYGERLSYAVAEEAGLVKRIVVRNWREKERLEEIRRAAALALSKVVNEAYALRVAEEYLKLTRLNFWNLETGSHKLALPVKMADTLAYMAALGIPVSA